MKDISTLQEYKFSCDHTWSERGVSSSTGHMTPAADDAPVFYRKSDVLALLAAQAASAPAAPPADMTEREALDMAIACGRSDKFNFRIPGTSDLHKVECAVLEASDALKLVQRIAQRLVAIASATPAAPAVAPAATPVPATPPLVKKYFDLPKGTRFRYPGGKRIWVALERHGTGLVAGYEPHDGALLGQSICSFADSEDECRSMEVEVVEDTISLHGPVALELPEGDTRQVKVWWDGIRDGKRHLCISVEAAEAAEPATTATAAEPSQATPYAYAVKFPDGQVSLLKDDPVGLRHEAWSRQGLVVHELDIRPARQPG